MFDSLRFDVANIVHVEVQLGCLTRNAFRDFFEFGVAASNNRSGASTLGRAVVGSETSVVIAS